MYQIEKQHFGIKITLGGFIRSEEMKRCLEEGKKLAADLPPPVGILIDMRFLKPLPVESQGSMREGQEHHLTLPGQGRVGLITANAITTMQFRRIAKETGTDKLERYINSKKQPNFEDLALRWIIDGDDSGIE